MPGIEMEAVEPAAVEMVEVEMAVVEPVAVGMDCCCCCCLFPLCVCAGGEMVPVFPKTQLKSLNALCVSLCTEQKGRLREKKSQLAKCRDK